MSFRIQQHGRTVESFPAGFTADEVCHAAQRYQTTGVTVVQRRVGKYWIQYAVFCHWVERTGDPA